MKALAYRESGWQQHVVSPTGAVGVMQIQPSTAYWLERDVFGYDLNIETSAYDNIKAGVRYLRILLDLTGDIDQAVADLEADGAEVLARFLSAFVFANDEQLRDWSQWPVKRVAGLLSVLEGDGRTDAQLFRQQRPGGPTSDAAAQKIMYWPSTNRVAIDDWRYLDLSDFTTGTAPQQ